MAITSDDVLLLLESFLFGDNVSADLSPERRVANIISEIENIKQTRYEEGRKDYAAYLLRLSDEIHKNHD